MSLKLAAAVGSSVCTVNCPHACFFLVIETNQNLGKADFRWEKSCEVNGSNRHRG